MKRIILTTVALFAFFGASAQKSQELKSPDGQLRMEINWQDGLNYSLSIGDEQLLEKSNIALELENGDLWSGVGEKPKVKVSTHSEEIESPTYRVQSFKTSYNELDIRFKEFGVKFRLYNEGGAYRFYTLNKMPIIIKDEIAQFNVNQDRLCYAAYSPSKKDVFATSFQNIYEVAKLSELPTEQPAFLPVTVAYDGETKLTILESDLESYPGMFVTTKGNNIEALFAPYPATMTAGDAARAMTSIATRESYIAKVDSARELPWRVLAVTTKDTQMPTNNLVFALASPNRIGDTSWIKEGQSIWEWWNDWGVSKVDFKAGINMETYRHYIDFASENEIAYLTVDEGWYVPTSGDMFNIIPELDIEEIVNYGKQKGVGIILWCVFNVLDDNLEEICAHYSAMGVKGLKVDFLNRDDQTAVEMVYRLAEVSAKHKLIVDLHGVYKPTGLNRTYPNVINIESVFGMEEVKWSNVEKNMPLYDVTFPYIRMMAGPVDFTPGAMRNSSRTNFKPIYYEPMSMGTRAHQVGLYVVYDSPLTMLADNTTAYNDDKETLDFITSIPAGPVLGTEVLDGKLGEYIITAREFSGNWFVGGLTNWDAREIELDFSFLGEGEYRVTLFKDGVNADKVASDYKIEKLFVTNNDKVKIRMASGGGFVAKIEQL